MANLQVANEILAQLGGGRFKVMTGAKNFVGGENTLHFDLPRSHKVRITLTERDDYTVDYFKWNARKLDLVKLSTRDGVYCDNLQDVFTDMTGLFTRL